MNLPWKLDITWSWLSFLLLPLQPLILYHCHSVIFYLINLLHYPSVLLLKGPSNYWSTTFTNPLLSGHCTRLRNKSYWLKDFISSAIDPEKQIQPAHIYNNGRYFDEKEYMSEKDTSSLYKLHIYPFVKSSFFNDFYMSF